ncbi:MAG TPA: cysteine desulfurase-like protein [Vicinamibacterales bacterium]
MFNVHGIRGQFPALSQLHDSRPIVFFDNPGGTQVPRGVIDAVSHYLTYDNANHGGAFATSKRSDAMLADAHLAMADMLGAASPREIVFGANMTTLTFAVSRALGRLLSPGDEILVTRLDHDANISPWVLLAEDRGAIVRWVDIHTADCTLDMDSLERQLCARTKIVAVGYAANSVGTINDVCRVVQAAKSVGALTFIDAVQYAPHGSIDVQQLGCDLLACSAYKFFGPHVGVLYGRLDLLESLRAYKVRPAGDQSPEKFETGTLNHEGIAGTRAAVEHLASLGGPAGGQVSRRQRIVAGLHAVHAHERELCARLLAGLTANKKVHVFGITEPARLDERVPTVSFTVDGHSPRAVSEHLAGAGIFVWDGHFYALAICERLGLQTSGGMVRVGLAHYNTGEEVDRLLNELDRLA